MSLKEIEEKIYKREEKEPEEETIYGVHSSLNEKTESPFAPTFFKTKETNKEDIWIKQDEERRVKKKKILKIAVISAAGAISLFGLVWGALYIRKSSFSEDRVTVSISGPQEVQSGDMAVFEISWKNENRATLRDAVIHIGYSENFKPLDNLNLESEGPSASRFNIGTIVGKGEGKTEIRGKFFGAKGLLVYIDAKLEYSSSNFSSQFVAEAKQNVSISSSPLVIEVSGPQSVFSGGAVSFSVKYKNTGQSVFRDLKMKADLPDNFALTASEPLPASGGNIWYIGDLEGGKGGEVKIFGTLSGQPQEARQFKFSLGGTGSNGSFIVYNETPQSVKIVGASISIVQTINEKKGLLFVNAGDNLYFNIKFKNVSDTAFRDLILSEEISSPILDYASFRDTSSTGSQGGLDSGKGIISWKAPGLEKLRVLNPGEEGELSFTIKVKDVIPISNARDKNFAFTAFPRIESPDIPTPEGQNKVISGNGITVKLNSKIIVRAEGYYNDAEIANSGPIPPKVGQETTFSIHIKVENIFNDVTDAKIVATLAPNVSWKENFSPKDANIDYNSRTNEITWNIGSLPAGVGTITDPKELVFQIGLVPSVNLIGQYAPLLNSTVFSAKDSFTEQKLEAKLGDKTSNLTEDLSVGGSGVVAQ